MSITPEQIAELRELAQTLQTYPPSEDDGELLAEVMPGLLDDLEAAQLENTQRQHEARDLREQMRDKTQVLREACADRDQLRAEVERLETVSERHAQRIAELKAEIDSQSVTQTSMVGRYEAEVTRLTNDLARLQAHGIAIVDQGPVIGADALHRKADCARYEALRRSIKDHRYGETAGGEG